MTNDDQRQYSLFTPTYIHSIFLAGNMKSEIERAEIIKAINLLLNQAYDSTLDEILALLQRIEAEEDAEDLTAYDAGKEDIRINGTVSWEEFKKEISKEVV
ncbi:MAG: hypothetical protein HEQ35_19680 [Gloeotrichia echinulata IR180]|jgi:hypothetical protein